MHITTVLMCGLVESYIIILKLSLKTRTLGHQEKGMIHCLMQSLMGQRPRPVCRSNDAINDMMV